jgi:hypothetical protein
LRAFIAKLPSPYVQNGVNRGKRYDENPFTVVPSLFLIKAIKAIFVKLMTSGAHAKNLTVEGKKHCQHIFSV